MFAPADYLDLEHTAHPKLFENQSYVWDALKQTASYLQFRLKPAILGELMGKPFISNHVFIGKGLILLMDSEDELANILGHEVEHIDNYHCVERFQLRTHLHDVPLAELLTLPVEFFQAGYTKEQELEADRDGTWLAVMAGYSPQGAVRMFEAFARLHREYVLKAGSPDQELSKVAIQGIVGYFRSHPLPEERINQIQQIMATRKWPEHPERSLRVRPV